MEFMMAFFISIMVLSAKNTVQTIPVGGMEACIGPGFVTEQKKLEEEKFYDDMALLAQLAEAEAGNQDEYGMRLVCDVVLNRVKSPEFPDTIEEVIYQPGQFSCIYDENFERAGWNISETAFRAAELEMTGERLDEGIIFFATRRVNGKNHWKHMDHWFSY